MINKNQVKNAKLILSNCLALTIRKQGTVHNYTGEFWMYENGYLLFQGFVSANAVCWWNESLTEAQKHLQYYGFVAPGILLVSADSYSLEVIRNAWSKSMLKPPCGYQITELGEIDNCIVTPCVQGQFAPLPEAICEAVFQITSRGQPAVPELIRRTLSELFAHIQQPSERLIYDCLARLTAERKLYQTSSGYFIVTPEQRRSRSQSRRHRRRSLSTTVTPGPRLMSNEEAMVFVHGDITTVRDGQWTHQCIQTNLTDVLSGGNEFDKVIYARNCTAAAATAFPNETATLDRRNSFRLFANHSKKLKRSVSTVTISKKLTGRRTATIGDFSTLGTSLPTAPATLDKKRLSFFSKWFRKSAAAAATSSKQLSTLTNGSLNGQFPPIEWFNSKIVHLHNVATQTNHLDIEYSSSLYRRRTRDTLMSCRSAETLPRRSSKQLPTAAATAPRVRHTNHESYANSTLPKRTATEKLPSVSDQTTTSGPSSLESATSASQVTIVPGTAAKKSLPPPPPPPSFMLQVKTNQKQNSGPDDKNRLTVTKSMTTINSGKNTKIYVENSPIRSVITFENHDGVAGGGGGNSGCNVPPPPHHSHDPKVVVINNKMNDSEFLVAATASKHHKNYLNENMNNEQLLNKKLNNGDQQKQQPQPQPQPQPPTKDNCNIFRESNSFKLPTAVNNSFERLDVINNCWPAAAAAAAATSTKVFESDSLNDLMLSAAVAAATKSRPVVSSVETLVDSAAV